MLCKDFWFIIMTTEEIKRKVGAVAADFVKDGMMVGLGTGSTAYYFIETLIERCQAGLKISAVASSKKSEEQARKGGIPILDIHKVSALDLAIDGADEIDSYKRMIKGGGGALVREKIVAAMSREMIVIIDESKLVSHLGKAKLPVEILQFGMMATAAHLEHLGYEGEFRKKDDGSLFITDNGNVIFDIQLEYPCEHPENDHLLLLSVPGIVDTGFFFELAGRVVVGFLDGQIVVQS